MNQPHDKVKKILGVCLDGLPFFFAFLFVTTITAWFAGSIWSLPLIVLSGWCLWFFRDPDRHPKFSSDKCVISPADGRIIQITEAEYPYILQGRALRVSVFMSVFNVHVNRIPMSGTITGLQYHPGKFLAAYAEKASLDNEQMGIVVEKNSTKVMFVQIAGLIARRIVCRLKEGEEVLQNQRFGLIRFGSRVDVYLPLGTRLSVHIGDKVKAGYTILGEL